MSALKRIMRALCVVLFALFAVQASAQAPSYGSPVTLDVAKKITAGAVAEAKRNNWNVAIAIVDTHGFLVYYERLDDTQTASGPIAIERARTAAMFRRPTKSFADRVAKGDVAIMHLPGATPFEGGLPIVSGGKIIGGIGVSGAAAHEDAQVGKAGLDGMK